MTLLEFFTESHIDNIAACLRLHPENMMIVGSIDQMRDPVKRDRKLLKQRKQRTGAAASAFHLSLQKLQQLFGIHMHHLHDVRHLLRHTLTHTGEHDRSFSSAEQS